MSADGYSANCHASRNLGPRPAPGACRSDGRRTTICVLPSSACLAITNSCSNKIVLRADVYINALEPQLRSFEHPVVITTRNRYEPSGQEPSLPTHIHTLPVPKGK